MLTPTLTPVRLDADDIVNLVMASASGCGAGLDTLLQEAYTLTVLDRRPFTEAVEDSEDRVRNVRNIISKFGLSAAAAETLERRGMRSLTLLSLAGKERAVSVVGSSDKSDDETNERSRENDAKDETDDVSCTLRLFAELDLHPLEPLWSLKRLMARSRETKKEPPRSSYLYFMDLERPKSKTLTTPMLPIGSFLGLMEPMEQLLKTPTLTTFYPDRSETDLPSRGQQRRSSSSQQTLHTAPKWVKNRKTSQSSVGKRRMASGRCAACGRGVSPRDSGRYCYQCSNDYERGRWNQKYHAQQRRTFYNGQYHEAQSRASGVMSSNKYHSPAAAKLHNGNRYALNVRNRNPRHRSSSPEVSQGWSPSPTSGLTAFCPWPRCSYVGTMQKLPRHVLLSHAFVPPMPIDSPFAEDAYGGGPRRKKEAVLHAHFDTMWLTVVTPTYGRLNAAKSCLDPVQFSFDGVTFFLMVSRDCTGAKPRSYASGQSAQSFGPRILFWLWAATKPQLASAFHFELMFYCDDTDICFQYCPLSLNGRAISLVQSFDQIMTKANNKMHHEEVLPVDAAMFHDLLGHGEVKYQLRIYTRKK